MSKFFLVHKETKKYKTGNGTTSITESYVNRIDLKMIIENISFLTHIFNSLQNTSNTTSHSFLIGKEKCLVLHRKFLFIY